MRPIGWLLALAVLAPAAVSQAPAEAARGLILGVQQAVDGGAERTDARVARLIALFVPEDRPPTPFLLPGRFRATWRGQLEIEFRDRYRFEFEGTGRLALRIDEEAIELGKAVRLGKGAHAVEARYESPERGPAVVRLRWAGSDFGAEPLAPQWFTHDPADPELQRGQSLRRGREILARRQCTKCHVPAEALVFAEHPMPELSVDAPLLTDVGTRLRPAWVARWVRDPSAVRPDATMPRLLHGPAGAEDARDVATYLSTLGAAPATAEGPADPAAAQQGGVLVAQLGCIACHTLPGAPPDGDRLSLTGVTHKWYRPALVAFLLNPRRHYEWIGMPDFGFEAAAARAVVAFLVTRDTGAPLEAFEPGNAARGHELVLKRGCLHCHFGGEVGSSRGPDWVKMHRLDHGCLAADAAVRGAAPDFGFDDRTRDDLRAAMPELKSLGRSTPAEFAARQMRALRCNACHARDGIDSQWTVHAHEVASLLDGVEPPKLAQLRPPLTWTGEKLRPEWTAALLRGEIKARPRPWLRARMPSFATAAAELAAGLAAQHGYGPAPERSGATDPEQVAIGKKLVGAEGGFACTLCHAVGKQPPIGVFEVQGINFTIAAERLRPDYFYRWMSNPLRIDPASRMPRYADDRGKTGLVDVLGGDARRQYEAIWQYLLSCRDPQ